MSGVSDYKVHIHVLFLHTVQSDMGWKSSIYVSTGEDDTEEMKVAKKRKKAIKSSLLQELQEEFSEAPHEVKVCLCEFITFCIVVIDNWNGN